MGKGLRIKYLKIKGVGAGWGLQPRPKRLVPL